MLRQACASAREYRTSLRKAWQKAKDLKLRFLALLNTESSEVFARVLFLRNFAYAKFRENKILAKWQNSVIY